MCTRLTTWVVATLTGLAAWATVPASAEAAGQPPTCNGLPATITEANSAGVVHGTDGDDVIVFSDAKAVEAMAGDDTICSRGGPIGHFFVHVDAGEGDDYVDASATSVGLFGARLGAGADTYVGSPGRDEVSTDAAASEGDALEGRDVVRTGAGFDSAFAGPLDGGMVNDDIDLGSGDSVLELYAAPSPEARMVASQDGRSRLLAYGGEGAWVVDLAGSELTIDEGEPVELRGFTEINLSARFEDFGPPNISSVHVVGGPAAEVVSYDGHLIADLGGGDDRVEGVADQLGDLRGGSGADSLVLGKNPRVPGRTTTTVDLRRGLLVLRGATRKSTALNGFENVSANLNRASLIGTSGSNRLTVLGDKCDVRLDGLGSDDVLRVSTKSRCGTVTPLNGGPGNDRLYGGDGRDALRGGRGRDVAVGGGNTDLCRAEVRRRCER